VTLGGVWSPGCRGTDCDYCDTYLTHDSPAVRKQHNARVQAQGKRTVVLPAVRGAADAVHDRPSASGNTLRAPRGSGNAPWASLQSQPPPGPAPQPRPPPPSPSPVALTGVPLSYPSLAAPPTRPPSARPWRAAAWPPSHMRQGPGSGNGGWGQTGAGPSIHPSV